MSASLTATWVEQNQCPLHQSILLTQGPIHEIFIKKYWELAELENKLFLSRPFWISKWPTQTFFFCFSYVYKNRQLLHIMYHLFLKYGCFPQNLGKEAVRTNRHTTVNEEGSPWRGRISSAYSLSFFICNHFFCGFDQTMITLLDFAQGWL